MLELDQLSRRYGNHVALDELSFSVHPGDVVGFLGPNGAGKTTAMRAVLGIVQPDSGNVRWNGSPVDHDARLRFGYMPEERGLYSTMTVIDQLVYLGRLHGMTDHDAKHQSTQWLDELGLGDRTGDRIDALSMGNQQRVQMAAALVHSPELLVLDEPFSGLDPTGIEALSRILEARAADGVAVVFSSHQLDLVEDLCRQVVIISRGRNVITGSTDELTVSNRVLSVEVVGDAVGTWATDLPGAEVEHVERGVVRLMLDEPDVADAVLDRARAAGSVRHFSFERRRLSEVFRDAVAS